MAEPEPNDSEYDSFRDRVQTYSLSELEDVFIHLDKETYPERLELVRAELKLRLDGLENLEQVEDTEFEPAGLPRRLAGGLVDLALQVLVLVLLFLVASNLFGFELGSAPPGRTGVPGGGRGGGGRGGRGGGRGGGTAAPDGLIDQGITIGTGLVTGNPEVWMEVGPTLGGYLLLKAMMIIPAWIRTGETTGMREVGVGLVGSGDQRVSVIQAVIRFLMQHVLFVLTLGISCLWMIWDGQKRTLHDKLVGTRVVRKLRTWEKPLEVRVYDL